MRAHYLLKMYASGVLNPNTAWVCMGVLNPNPPAADKTSAPATTTSAGGQNTESQGAVFYLVSAHGLLYLLMVSWSHGLL